MPGTKRLSATKRSRTSFTVDDVVARLRTMGDPRNVEGMARFGINITSHTGFGVPLPDLRKLAKEIGRDHALALALWDTGIHDARHIAAMIADPANTTKREMDRWVRDLNSWDITDGACFDLWRHTPHAYVKAAQWVRRKPEFERRAGFALMAGLAVSDKLAADDRFLAFLPLIEEASDDDRNFVRKAVNWALRQIGKRNFALNAAAIGAAERIAARGTRSARWIAADALRELRSEAVQRRLRGAARPSARSRVR
jgi:3-methyladenine DNA glycosylase AlkD